MFNDFALPEGVLGCLTLGGGAARAAEEYLTIEEVAQRLKLSPKSVRNKMATGILREGEHYFRPAGMGPRFKWSTLVAWMEGGEPSPAQLHANYTTNSAPARADAIPMARGYVLGGQ